MMRMSRREFREWAAERADERYERVAGGRPSVWSIRASRRASGARSIARSPSGTGPCEALPDGIAVEIGEDCDYEPDAIVNCGDRLPSETLAAPAPIIIFEVLSPSARGRDAGAKLADYLSLPSVRHYLLVRTERQSVIHHRRTDDGGIQTRRHGFFPHSRRETFRLRHALNSSWQR